MNKITERKKQIQHLNNRKQLLIDTINDLVRERIYKAKEIAEILDITEPTLSRFRNDKNFSVTLEKVEEYFSKLID